MVLPQAMTKRVTVILPAFPPFVQYMGYVIVFASFFSYLGIVTGAVGIISKNREVVPPNRNVFNTSASSIPTRLTLMCEPQFMHAPVNGRPRLQERPFKIGLMVLLSMVVRHGSRLIPWT